MTGPTTPSTITMLLSRGDHDTATVLAVNLADALRFAYLTTLDTRGGAQVSLVTADGTDLGYVFETQVPYDVDVATPRCWRVVIETAEQARTSSFGYHVFAGDRDDPAGLIAAAAERYEEARTEAELVAAERELEPGTELTYWAEGWSPVVDGAIPLDDTGRPIAFPTMTAAQAWDDADRVATFTAAGDRTYVAQRRPAVAGAPFASSAEPGGLRRA